MMNDPIFDEKAQAAKSSLDDALGVAQRVQQRLGAMAAPGGPPAPGQPPQAQPGQKPQQPAQQVPQAAQPAVWPQMPGVNPLLQQLASQYSQQQAPTYQPQQQAPAKSFARGGLAVF